ncbi:NUDIX domain-containing protein [Candidatus Uhrbacteria bacterium]|nr:NUDIX domain-containing protein [Candidatus Uhrbacteria bacterium]
MSKPKNQPVPIVLALLKNNEGKFLLQLRHDEDFLTANNKWELPGGKIEFGEQCHETAIRECREEIGCEIEIVRALPLFISNIWEHADGSKAQAICLSYEGRIVSGEPESREADVKEIGWFTPEEVTKLDCLPGIQEIVKLAISTGSVALNSN